MAEARSWCVCVCVCVWESERTTKCLQHLLSLGEDEMCLSTISNDVNVHVTQVNETTLKRHRRKINLMPLFFWKMDSKKSQRIPTTYTFVPTYLIEFFARKEKLLTVIHTQKEFLFNFFFAVEKVPNSLLREFIEQNVSNVVFYSTKYVTDENWLVW